MPIVIAHRQTNGSPVPPQLKMNIRCTKRNVILYVKALHSVIAQVPGARILWAPSLEPPPPPLLEALAAVMNGFVSF